MTCGSIGGIPQHVNPPKGGFFPRGGWGQPYGCGRDVTAAGSAAGAAVLPTATLVPASPAGGSTGGSTSAGSGGGGSPAGGSASGTGAGIGAGVPDESDVLGASGCSSAAGGRTGGPAFSKRLGVGVRGVLSPSSSVFGPLPVLSSADSEPGDACDGCLSSWPPEPLESLSLSREPSPRFEPRSEPPPRSSSLVSADSPRCSRSSAVPLERPASVAAVAAGAAARGGAGAAAGAPAPGRGAGGCPRPGGPADGFCVRGKNPAPPPG